MTSIMQQSPDGIQRLWQQLARIKSYRYTSQPGVESLSGWRGEGHGTVQVEKSDYEIQFHESGLFRPSSGKEVNSRNVFRWRKNGTTISLSHNRRDDPVHLFDLAPVSDIRWCSATPHHCGEDVYCGELEIITTGFNLVWQINGPGKNETLCYFYCHE